MQNEIFIQSIDIKQVRHLHNIHIPIAENERKHLILTGKNGSGKTSVLEEIRDFLGKAIIGKVSVAVLNIGYIHSEKAKNNFFLLYFSAKRQLKFNEPKGIEKIDILNLFNSEEPANQIFLQYLVNLKAQRSFARDDNKMDVVQKIDAWFIMFEASLQEIFDDKTLTLEFDNQNFTFNILQAGKERFDFNTLSDGYSAILHIVTELMLRMEHKTPQVYDRQGIVLIDEIEAHLHIDLQKKILPFLTRFFPQIQFIVTTHSPFVITSIDNAVVFDLENQVPITSLSHLSVSGVIEGYFHADKYSEHIKELVTEYETLTQKTILNEDEKDRAHYLRKYFKDLPKFMSNELAIKIQQIELSKLQLA
jgi:predicted ATP-binding protein involved in virulence